jgi:pimeloyl-ACP methyl ester carboxylesterase
MASPGALRAARKGRAARARYAETEEFDEASFVEADWAALAGDWAALGADAQRAERAGPGGLIDDDVAFAGPWNVDPAIIRQPVLMVQGGLDRIVPPAHTEHLLRRLPHGELWLRPRDGHVSVLAAVPVALDWLAASAGSAG